MNKNNYVSNQNPQSMDKIIDIQIQENRNTHVHFKTNSLDNIKKNSSTIENLENNTINISKSGANLTHTASFISNKTNKHNPNQIIRNRYKKTYTQISKEKNDLSKTMGESYFNLTKRQFTNNSNENKLDHSKCSHFKSKNTPNKKNCLHLNLTINNSQSQSIVLENTHKRNNTNNNPDLLNFREFKKDPPRSHKVNNLKSKSLNQDELNNNIINNKKNKNLNLMPQKNFNMTSSIVNLLTETNNINKMKRKELPPPYIKKENKEKKIPFNSQEIVDPKYFFDPLANVNDYDFSTSPKDQKNIFAKTPTSIDLSLNPMSINNNSYNSNFNTNKNNLSNTINNENTTMNNKNKMYSSNDNFHKGNNNKTLGNIKLPQFNKSDPNSFQHLRNKKDSNNSNISINQNKNFLNYENNASPIFNSKDSEKNSLNQIHIDKSTIIQDRGFYPIDKSDELSKSENKFSRPPRDPNINFSNIRSIPKRDFIYENKINDDYLISSPNKDKNEEYSKDSPIYDENNILFNNDPINKINYNSNEQDQLTLIEEADEKFTCHISDENINGNSNMKQHKENSDIYKDFISTMKKNDFSPKSINFKQEKKNIFLQEKENYKETNFKEEDNKINKLVEKFTDQEIKNYCKEEQELLSSKNNPNIIKYDKQNLIIPKNNEKIETKIINENITNKMMKNNLKENIKNAKSAENFYDRQNKNFDTKNIENKSNKLKNNESNISKNSQNTKNNSFSDKNKNLNKILNNQQFNTINNTNNFKINKILNLPNTNFNRNKNISSSVNKTNNLTSNRRSISINKKINKSSSFFSNTDDNLFATKIIENKIKKTNENDNSNLNLQTMDRNFNDTINYNDTNESLLKKKSAIVGKFSFNKTSNEEENLNIYKNKKLTTENIKKFINEQDDKISNFDIVNINFSPNRQSRVTMTSFKESCEFDFEKKISNSVSNEDNIFSSDDMRKSLTKNILYNRGNNINNIKNQKIHLKNFVNNIKNNKDKFIKNLNTENNINNGYNNSYNKTLNNYSTIKNNIIKNSNNFNDSVKSTNKRSNLKKNNISTKNLDYSRSLSVNSHKGIIMTNQSQRDISNKPQQRIISKSSRGKNYYIKTEIQEDLNEKKKKLYRDYELSVVPINNIILNYKEDQLELKNFVLPPNLKKMFQKNSSLIENRSLDLKFNKNLFLNSPKNYFNEKLNRFKEIKLNNTLSPKSVFEEFCFSPLNKNNLKKNSETKDLYSNNSYIPSKNLREIKKSLENLNYNNENNSKFQKISKIIQKNKISENLNFLSLNDKENKFNNFNYIYDLNNKNNLNSFSFHHTSPNNKNSNSLKNENLELNPSSQKNSKNLKICQPAVLNYIPNKKLEEPFQNNIMKKLQNKNLFIKCNNDSFIINNTINETMNNTYKSKSLGRNLAFIPELFKKMTFGPNEFSSQVNLANKINIIENIEVNKDNYDNHKNIKNDFKKKSEKILNKLKLTDLTTERKRNKSVDFTKILNVNDIKLKIRRVIENNKLNEVIDSMHSKSKNIYNETNLELNDLFKKEKQYKDNLKNITLNAFSFNDRNSNLLNTKNTNKSNSKSKIQPLNIKKIHNIDIVNQYYNIPRTKTKLEIKVQSHLDNIKDNYNESKSSRYTIEKLKENLNIKFNEKLNFKTNKNIINDEDYNNFKNIIKNNIQPVKEFIDYKNKSLEKDIILSDEKISEFKDKFFYKLGNEKERDNGSFLYNKVNPTRSQQSHKKNYSIISNSTKSSLKTEDPYFYGTKQDINESSVSKNLDKLKSLLKIEEKNSKENKIYNPNNFFEKNNFKYESAKNINQINSSKNIDSKNVSIGNSLKLNFNNDSKKFTLPKNDLKIDDIKLYKLNKNNKY